MSMKRISISQFKDGELTAFDDIVAEENVLHLEINKDVSFDVIISPSDIKEFVYGNLLSEGFIKVKGDVQNYKEKIKKSLIRVNVKLKDFPMRKTFLKKNYNIVWTECGSTGELTRLGDRFQRFGDDFKINADEILNIFDEIKDKIDLFKQTGAFHYAFMLDKNAKLVSYAYDIGRHNAVDKALGHILLTQDPEHDAIHDKILYITGRISSDILLKCLRARVPVIISRSAPLDSAVNLAREHNLCLIGFLRGKRFNVYSNPDAVIVKK